MFEFLIQIDYEGTESKAHLYECIFKVYCIHHSIIQANYLSPKERLKPNKSLCIHNPLLINPS